MKSRAHIPHASGIYRIVNTVTQKVYIGSANDLYQRWNNHMGYLDRKEHHNPKLQASWNKHGKDAFVFEVMELILPPFLIEREQYWLDREQPFGTKGYNIARIAMASRTGSTHTIESKAKMSASHKGQISYWKGRKRPPETLAKMSAANIGKIGPWRGKTRPPETLEKMRIAATGHVHTPEARAKISAAGTGRIDTPETTEKRRLAALGHTHTEDAKKKMSIAKKRTLIIIEPDGTEHVVHGVQDFCKERGLDQSNLTRVAQGKQKQYRGWTARFPSEGEAASEDTEATG
jgi:group I intron endonuclease